MKEGLRFVDCDMHVMEPPDLFGRYLDSKFSNRVIAPVDSKGRPRRGMLVIDGKSRSMDDDLEQYRKPTRTVSSNATQPLSGSRIAEENRLEFAIERDYNAEAQVMAMAI